MGGRSARKWGSPWRKITERNGTRESSIEGKVSGHDVKDRPGGPWAAVYGDGRHCCGERAGGQIAPRAHTGFAYGSGPACHRRARIAQHYQDWYGLKVSPERIAVTTGASGAFPLAFLAAFDPGDRIALAAPYYPPYVNILIAL